VPSLIPTPAGTTLQSSVLLLEEYDALAVAIGSALKKFAPGHPVSVARSLAEAETLAGQTCPALFVVDVDPPWPGLIDFVGKMGDANPDARVLIIGAAIPKEIADERASFGALQFIEKPFELADFGAAVQALLGPWRESESASSRGTLGTLNLSDIVLVQCAAGANAIVEVESDQKRYGEIHVVEGQISHVETGELTGAEALEEIFTWSEPTWSEGKRNPSANRTIRGPWANVFLEVLRRTGAAQPVVTFPAKEQAQAPSTSAAAKKIVVIDDTEMLLIFVEDVLATEHPEWQITTASTSAAGCKEVERILPDLVLLDYSLPDFNGDEVCRRLLQGERTAHVPVLMMSGHVAEMKASATRFENIVATIEKPFLSEALIDLVQRTLEGAPPRMEVPFEQVAPAEIHTPTPSVSSKIETKRLAHVEPVSMRPRASSISSLAPAESKIMRGGAPIAAPVSASVISTSNDAVFGLFLDVLSMQFTPQLQMGTIRARPSSLTVSLHLPSSALRESLPVETGFQLGRTELDANGHITKMRLIPTMKPFQPAKTRNAFEIGDVAVVPGEKRERVQLTPTMTAPMTMHLLAHLDLAGVELSSTFQVSQVVLKWRGSRVRVTLSAKATGGDAQGAEFEIAVVQVDPDGRLTELLLNPIR
jgi:DNA-binding response OmpR family regulator